MGEVGALHHFLTRLVLGMECHVQSKIDFFIPLGATHLQRLVLTNNHDMDTPLLVVQLE